MANLIPAVTRHEIARSVYRDIITGRDFYYVFAGKTFEDGSEPEDTRHFIADVHKNMVLAKRVVPGPSDVVYMIRRKDWESGAVYVEYSDYDEMAYVDEETNEFVVSDFYVMTDEYKIYKCIKAGPGTSTYKPTHTSPEIVEEGDFYVWKFMYEVPVLDRIKFLTEDYIPVRNVSDGVNYDVNGVIDSVRIEEPGEGYITPYLVIKGDGLVPTTISFNGDTSVDDTEYTIEYIGHNFATGDAVVYSASGGITIGNLTNNAVYYVIFYTKNKIRLASSLSNAENNDYIEITPGEGISHTLTPVGTTADITIDAYGSITTINITNSLRGYTHARAVMYDAKTTPADYDPNVSGSEIFLGTITADMESLEIQGINTEFTTQLEEGWTLTDHHNDIIGVISSIESNTKLYLQTYAKVDVPNQNYGAFAGGGFEGIVILEPETASVVNTNVVLETVHGAIYKVDIIDGGLGYETPVVNVIGDGSGAKVYIDPDEDINENGTITNVSITDFGQNYNYAHLEVVGANEEAATLRAHVGPQRGHGFNICQELFAHSLCISATITTENADLFQGNDYRQLGIVKNPKLYNATQDTDIGYFQEDTGTAAFIITVPASEYTEYSADDEIHASTGGIYKVLTKVYDEAEDEYRIYLIYTEGTEGLTVDATFNNVTTLAEDLICTAVTEPEFDKNTGTVIYVNSFSPISRTAEQFETIKLFLHF